MSNPVTALGKMSNKSEELLLISISVPQIKTNHEFIENLFVFKVEHGHHSYEVLPGRTFLLKSRIYFKGSTRTHEKLRLCN